MTEVAMHLRIGLLMSALFVAGCGVGDYERSMDAERKRIQLFDDENRLLGDAVEQPVELAKDNTEKNLWPFEVFLRLPASVSGTVAARYQGITVPVFRYSGGASSDYHVYVAAGMVVEKNKENLYKPGEFPGDDFRQGVRFAIKDAYKKMFDFSPQRLLSEQPVKEQRQPVSWRGEDRPALDLEKYEGNDRDNKRNQNNQAFELYIHRLGNRVVAVCYQVPERIAKDKATVDTIDLSLKTLDIGEEAGSRRSEFASYRGGKAP
jgi:hypothetical protein